MLSSVYRTFIVPLADVISTKIGSKIILELPGVKKADISIDQHDTTLSVIAKKVDPIGKDEKRVGYSEIQYGDIRSDWTLPKDADIPKIEACYADGVLTINIPRKEVQKVGIKIN